MSTPTGAHLGAGRGRSTGSCVRCRRVKTKCMYETEQVSCRACLRGGYECVFISKADRMANKRRRIRSCPTVNRTPTIADQTQISTPGATSPGVTARSSNVEEELSPELLEECQELLETQTFLGPFSPFHWPTFRRKLIGRDVEESLLYAFLATTSRASQRLTARFGSPVAVSDFFSSKSRRCILNHMDNPSIGDVQALLAIILLDWGASRGTQAYMYLGLASRMALRFLPAADHRLATDFLASEETRRTIWLVFMMEQFLCTGYGRIPAMRARDMQISLPCSEMDYLFATQTIVPMLDGGRPPLRLPDDTVGSMSEFGSILQICSIWHLVVTWRSRRRPDEPADPQLDQFEATLLEWQASLPSQYRDKQGRLDLHISLGTGLLFGFIHCVYHCTLVVFHRQRLYTHRQEGSALSDDNGIRDVAIETIFSSAERILELTSSLEAATAGNIAVLVPKFMLFACFIASSAIADISIRQWTNARQASFKIVRESLRILRDMRHDWPLIEEWHVQLTSMVKVLQDRALGIDSKSPQELLLETLLQGPLGTETTTLIPTRGEQTPTVNSTMIGTNPAEKVGSSQGSLFYSLELVPDFSLNSDQSHDTPNGLSVFLGC
ncbi:hypothetical protein F5Y08DRAFT_172073 [Xylaria arbuscula]|nr:hypothetical protein F5Y08DRAFT_172073 [Xylaria arbuscula]